MNLFKETQSFFIWFYQVLRAFLQVRFWSSLSTIALSTLSRILNIIATVLPFKILLLGASDGIPSYFTFLISPEYKTEWVIALGVGLVISYLASIYFDSVATKISDQASSGILQESAVIPLLNNQQELVRDYYSKVCKILAEIIFFLSGIFAGLYLSLNLFIFLLFLILFLYSIIALLVKTSDHITPSYVGSYIRDNLNNFLGTATTLVFLSCFLFLLIPFLFTDYSNILAAIIAIILIRQLMNALKTVVKEAVNLSKAAHKVNALVFPDIQLLPQENPLEKAHRDIFYKQGRLNLVYRELAARLHLAAPPDVCWQDSTIPGVDTYTITVRENPATEDRQLMQQVFPPKQSQKLEHEDFLFQHIPRLNLHAPKRIALFFVGPFQCQICDYGLGQRLQKQDWPDAQMHLLQQTWSCSPPLDLVRSYFASTPLLQHRLNEELLDQVEVAVDTQEESNNLQLFRDYLSWVRTKLDSLPLYVYNPDLSQNNVIYNSDSDFLIMTWCRWALEPIGAGMPSNLKENDLLQILEAVVNTRNDFSKDINTEDILFASKCYQLEQFIKNRKYKAALNHIKSILQN